MGALFFFLSGSFTWSWSSTSQIVYLLVEVGMRGWHCFSFAVCNRKNTRKGRRVISTGYLVLSTSLNGADILIVRFLVVYSSRCSCQAIFGGGENSPWRQDSSCQVSTLISCVNPNALSNNNHALPLDLRTRSLFPTSFFLTQPSPGI